MTEQRISQQHVDEILQGHPVSITQEQALHVLKYSTPHYPLLVTKTAPGVFTVLSIRRLTEPLEPESAGSTAVQAKAADEAQQEFRYGPQQTTEIPAAQDSEESRDEQYLFEAEGDDVEPRTRRNPATER